MLVRNPVIRYFLLPRCEGNPSAGKLKKTQQEQMGSIWLMPNAGVDRKSVGSCLGIGHLVPTEASDFSIQG